MGEPIRMQPGESMPVAFLYLTGKECNGKAGQQKYFSIDGDRALFVPVANGIEIEQQLALQRIAAGETVDLMYLWKQRGNWRGKVYEVKRIDPAPPPQQPEAANRIAAPGPAADQQPACNQNGNTHSNGNGNGHAPVSADAAAPPKTKLEDALKTVVAAVVATRQYAAEIGFTMPEDLSWEDLRTMANTLLMNGNGNGGRH